MIWTLKSGKASLRKELAQRSEGWVGVCEAKRKRKSPLVRTARPKGTQWVNETERNCACCKKHAWLKTGLERSAGASHAGAGPPRLCFSFFFISDFENINCLWRTA